MVVAPSVISTAVEGPLDEAVAARLIAEAGAVLGPVHGKNGKAQLLERLDGYNRAAHFAPWLVLVDLDQDMDCAPPFRLTALPTPAPTMCFRIAVREVESWLLADRETLARFLSLSINRLPLQPDREADPKRLIVDVARHSRRRDIREGIVPRPGSGRVVGPTYTSLMIQFSRTHWRPDIAARHSDSLRRCRERLQELVEAQSRSVKDQLQ